MTINSPAAPPSFHQLRQCAEERLRLSPDDVSAMSPDQVQILVHELQLQNEELLRTQMELAEIRDRCFDLLEFAPVGYITVGPDYRVQHCNLSAADMLGMDRSKVENSVLAALVAREDRDSCFLALRETLQTGRRQTWEYAIACPAGKTRYVQLAISPLDEQMPASGCRVTLTDITQRKDAEAALRAKEARLRAFFDQAADSIVVHDLSGRVLEVNQQACASLGYSREELMRLSLPDFDTNIDGDSAQAICLQTTPCKPLTVTGQYRRKDGTTFPVEIRIGCFDLEGERYYLALARDITDRRRKEVQLERIRDQLAEAQQIAHLGSWEYIAATQETVWSDEQKRIFGMDPNGPSPAYGELLRHYIHPDDAAEWDRRFRSSRQSISSFESEHRIVRPDGNVRHIYSKAQPFFDETGKLVRYVGTTLDITERRAMQEKVQLWNAELEHTVASRTAELTAEQVRTAQALKQVARSESRFRTIFELAPLGVSLIDSLTGKVHEVNPRFAEIVGRKREELTTIDSESFALPDDVRQELDNMASLNAEVTLSVQRNKRHIRPDGSLVWISMTFAPVNLGAGESPLYLCMIEDITGRREAEERIRRNEEKYRSLVESISECVWEVDVQGCYTYLSPRFQELTGYSPAEFLGNSAAGLIAEQGKVLLREWMQSGGEDQLNVPKTQFQVRRKDGQLCDVEVKATRRYSETGEYLGLRGITQDVTQRNQAEESLKRFNETLEQQVQQRTAAIRMLRDVAAMANDSQDPLRAAEYCLKQLAALHGWLCGHAWWITAENEQFLSPRCVWYPEDTVRWDDFRTVTLQTRSRRNAGLLGRAIAGGRPHWTTQLQRMLNAPRAAVARKLGLATAVAVPVFARGKPVAVLELFSDCQLPCDPKTMDVLTGVALQLSRIVERREFDEHLMASTEDVRRGIARDLHDDVGQELTGVSLMAAALAKLHPPSTRPAIKLSANIAAALSRTHEKLRRLCHSAMPMELQEGNLVGALTQLAAFTGDNSRIECAFVCERPEWVFDVRSSTQLYRIAQEAIANAIRHARARSIRIAMQQKGSDILLTIEDNGKGLTGDWSLNQGLGMQTMRYRAGLLGGTLEVDPGENRGTRVVCRVPTSPRSS